MLAMEKAESDVPSSPGGWTFLTNHAHVLLCLAGNPEARMRDVAVRVGVTERAVQRIVAELEEAGYLSHVREGRANVYTVHESLHLRHPVEHHCTIAELIGMVVGDQSRIGGRRSHACSAEVRRSSSKG